MPLLDIKSPRQNECIMADRYIFADLEIGTHMFESALKLIEFLGAGVGMKDAIDGWVDEWIGEWIDG